VLESGKLDPQTAQTVNRAILEVERNWLNPDGIPGRPWFRHLLYAARYTYAHLELPGITEAVEAKDWKLARVQADLLASALQKNTALLNQAADALEGSASKGATANLEPLEVQIAKIRQAFPGDMAVYMKNLVNGQELAIDADTIYETFSVIKVPIMAEVLRQVEAGKLELSERYQLKPADARWPSGVLYTMDPGLNPTIKDLLTLMIIISDNSATDILGDLVGREQVTRTMASLGLSKTTIQFSDLDWDRKWLGSLDARFLNAPAEKVMEFPFGKYTDEQVRDAFGRTIWDSGIYFGHSTARETGRLMELIARKQLVSPQASELMLSILKKQQVDDRFPRYLRDVGIAHKTGDGQPFLANDAGILWVDEQPVVLVVFTAHHRGPTSSLHDAIARVAAYVALHYGGKTKADFLAD
jgi:beta-lactamase class A